MVRKPSKPVIEIPTESFVSGDRAGPVDVATSPRNHMEMETKPQSPRALKSFDFGGVGLGIVVALQKSLSGRNLSLTYPIPVKSQNISSRNGRNSEEMMGMDSFEEYTIVTCHRANKSYSKVYSNRVERGNISNTKIPYRIQSGVFDISPAKISEAAGIPAPDFLSACNLCKKELLGKDIYMYREKAFCSTECRYMQIALDERLEKCNSDVAKPVEVAAGSPYACGQILTSGILAI